MRQYIIVITLLIILAGCGSNGSAPSERTQAAIVQTQAALTQGTLAALRATQIATTQATDETQIATNQAAEETQIAVSQTREANISNGGIAQNVNWTPVEQDFEGVTMVLVPAGCFMMGSDDGEADVSPVHQQCFDQPFWIDKYEVTQTQFRGLGGIQANAPGFSGANRPVERITWFEALDFCELRNGRLPTEAEWEYAARGPDGLIYPWGNTWNANNAVWNRINSQGTANVGNIPAGISWAGALDMSGNVWEWTSSLDDSYPYDPADGREADTGTRTNVRRVLRGGSWVDVRTDNLGAPRRVGINPNSRDFSLGFRCARSYE